MGGAVDTSSNSIPNLTFYERLNKFQLNFSLKTILSLQFNKTSKKVHFLQNILQFI